MTGSDVIPGVRPVRDDDSAALIELIDGCWAEYPGCVLDVDAEEPWLRAPATVYAAAGGACRTRELHDLSGTTEYEFTEPATSGEHA